MKYNILNSAILHRFILEFSRICKKKDSLENLFSRESLDVLFNFPQKGAAYSAQETFSK